MTVNQSPFPVSLSLAIFPQLYAPLPGYSQPLCKEFLPLKFSSTKDTGCELWEQGSGVGSPLDITIVCWMILKALVLESGVRDHGRSQKTPNVGEILKHCLLLFL